ncbi:MAG: TVP38/TMEM64 family protein [Raoultibacter sp.]|jgi:uncharacterized membrane protein YdjX (TVP38/TMEM64 family)
MSNKEKQAKRFGKADVFKFVGLLVFLGLMTFVVFLLWPYIKELFTEGGVQRVLHEVQNAGAAGVFILLGLQFLQIVVAFIPGEVTQIAAGMLYGPWFGGLIILIGCIISSAFIFVLVRKLGAPFVQALVSTKHLGKFVEFEKSGKLNTLVFVLFLIPGLPKDVFTYLVPLTGMRMRDFLVLSNIGRIPGIMVSTYAAGGLVEGDIVSSIIIFSIGALLAILGYVFRDKLINLAGKIGGKAKQVKNDGSDKIVQKKTELHDRREERKQDKQERKTASVSGPDERNDSNTPEH